MSDLNFRVQPTAVVGKHGVNKIARMLCSGIALERGNEFAVVIVGGAAATLTGIISALAMDDVTAFDSLVTKLARTADFIRQVAHCIHHRNRSGIVIYET